MLCWCLQRLNIYCDDVACGRRPAAARLEFYVHESDGALGRVEAPLPGHGSLGPLFLAFGLITEDELRRGVGAAELGAPPDRDSACVIPDPEAVESVMACATAASPCSGVKRGHAVS